MTRRRNGAGRRGSKPRFYRPARPVPGEIVQSQLDSTMATPFSSHTRRLIAGGLAALALSFAVAPRVEADTRASTLLVVGDSISAAYGLPPGVGWVDLLAARL